MRLMIYSIAAIALVGCSKQQPADTGNGASGVAVNAPAATPAAFQLDETSWTFTDKDGKPMQESIDANGNYVATSNGTHIDHGTAVMKGDKGCFTSAMNKNGEICWTTKPVDVGQSMDIVNDKDEKLTVTRVAYVPAPAAK